MGVEVQKLNIKGSAMKKPFMQVASDGTHELIVEGVISSDLWWGDEFTPDMVRDELSGLNGEPIRIIINSPGGEVFAGAAIYNALREYKGRKTVRVDGVAASMASVIAMVGDEIIMNPGSTMMVHRPLVMAYGNVNDMQKAIDMLTAIEETIIPIYEKRTGLTKDQVFELLDAETWMSADKAVELGFADSQEEVEPKASAFDKIKAMLTNEQFAFSMSAVHKSLEGYVATAEAPKEETNVQTEETKETEVVETKEVVEETTDVTEEVTVTEEVKEEAEVVTADTADEDEPSVEETPVEEEVTEPTDTDTKQPVAKVNMKKQVVAEVVTPEAKADPAIVTDEAKKITKVEARKLIVEALAAKYGKDEKAFDAVSEKIKASMVIDGTSGAPLFVEEVLANDIRQQYEIAGRVGSLVNRIDIDGAETFRQLVETAGNGFTPVALGATKDLDQPVWTSVVFEPFEWALIVAWLDGVQKRSPIAVYNQIVRYVAREYAKLEDKIVLTYAGGTYDGETRPATGLVPILTTATRVLPVAGYGSEFVIPALGAAYGEVRSDGTITLVTNRKTWANLAVSMDANDHPIFTVVGEQVAAGALGTFNVVLSEQLVDGDVVVGDFSDYNLVTRGGLEYLFSREATVGDGDGALNLFTNDASALRADIDITGKPVFNTSFYLLQFATS